MGIRRAATILLLVCPFSVVWAGKEFPAKPGETYVTNELIVGLAPSAASFGTSSAVVATYLPGSQISYLGGQRLYKIAMPGGIPPGVAARLAADVQVEFVEPNRVRKAIVAAPNDPSYASSWWWQTVQALQAWSLLPGQYLTAATAGSGRMTVAIIDTGADCTHPDFINTGGSSTDSAHGGQLVWSLSQAYYTTTVSSPACAWQDDYGHGTHVTGILAAATSNAAGVSGLGYPLQVIEYKALDSNGSGNDSTIAAAIIAAVNAHAQVISMSLGGDGYSQALQSAVNYAWQNNTLVVAAAGNNASSSLFFPAGANHAVGVSATDSNNNLASFSNFGNSVQLAAPGVSIYSTAPTYPVTTGWFEYVSLSGTSMATPFVAAAAGLTAMTTPNASVSSIVQRMEQTAASSTVGGGWTQSFGYGIVNAYNAISATVRGATSGGVIGQIVIPGNSTSGAQITINGQAITTDTTGLYRFAALPPGTYPVSVSATGFTTLSLSVTVAPGADTQFPVTMGTTYGKFVGQVSDQGAGVPGAIVEGIATTGTTLGIVGTAVADPNGQYTLWIPAGSSYTVRASQIGRTTVNVSSLSVTGGGSTTVNLALSHMGTISGTVLDGNQNPVANSQVLATAAGFSSGAVPNAGGHYSLIGLPSGTYSVTASAPNYFSATQNGVVVASDSTAAVNLQLQTQSQVAAPLFNPPAGSYGTPQAVQITTSTQGASIRYTIDGSNPSETAGTLYQGAVIVSGTTTLKAIAYESGASDSSIGSATYTTPIAAPVFSVPAGSYTTPQAVQITTSKVGASIRYTTDGTTPTETMGTLYQGAVAIGATATLNAIAYESGMIDSPITSALYTIGSGAPAWYNNAWAYREQITIPHGSVSGAMSLTNFPLLYSVTDPNLMTVANGGSVAQSNGNDILFTASDGVTKLNHEIEQYNGATGKLIAWVNVLALSPTADTSIFVYYGNPSAPNQQAPAGVWDGNYKMVQHFPNGSSLTANDSTANGVNGTVAGATAATGQIGGAAGFNGGPNYIDYGANTAVNGSLNSSFTFSTWVNSTGAQGIVFGNTGGDEARTIGMWPAFGSGLSIIDAEETNICSTGSNLSAGWHYLTWTFNSNANVLYVDGAVGCTATFSFFGGQPFSGNYQTGSTGAQGGPVFTGAIDETRVSNIARTPTWIVTEYNNQKSPSTFYSVGAQSGPGGTPPTTVTTSPPGLSLTVDSVSCIAPCVFQWAQGTVHTIAVTTTPQAGTAGTQYVYAGWSDGLAQSHSITVNTIPTYTASFTTQYYLTTSAGAGGSIGPASAWINAGTTQSVAATANTGYQFTGFTGGALSGTTTPQNLTMNGPAAVTANFVLISSLPIALVQHTYTRAVSPIAVSFPSNVTTGNLIVVAVSADLDSATVSSISDSQGNPYFKILQGVESPGGNNTELWYAKNVTGGAVKVTVAMSGGNSHFVMINEFSGLDTASPLDRSAINTSPTAPVWSSGVQTTQYSNELIFGFKAGGYTNAGSGFTLIDSGVWNQLWGTEYRIVSNAGSYDAEWPGQNYNGYGAVLMATFKAAGGGAASTTVTSSPPGLSLTVDSASCAAPCVFQWAQGTTHTIAVTTTPQAGAAGTQYVYGSWSDGLAQSHSITVGSIPAYTASFTTQYYLTTAANPASEGSIGPASGWINAGTTQPVSATANTGYQFNGFTGGALSGTTTPQNLTMNGPATVTANFAPISSSPSIALVQHTYTRSGSPIAVSFGSNVTTGNLIVVAVSADVDGATVSSITDTAGNTYVRIQQGLEIPDGGNAELWYAKNVTGGVVKVTVTMVGSTSHFVMIHEFSGLDKVNPLDQSAINTDPTAPVWSSGAQTTQSANELIFGFEIGGFTNAGAGFTLIDAGSWNQLWGTEYRIVSGAGSYDVEWSGEPYNGYGAVIMATFKAGS